MVSAVALGLPATAAAQSVKIDGDVATPRSYTRAQLGELPKIPVGKARGPSVEALIDAAAPAYPEGTRNGFLRTTLTVRGARGPAVVLALGELLPDYGNQPAVLSLTGGDVKLRVRGDRSTARVVDRVRRITVEVQAPAPSPPPSAGAITIDAAGKPVVMTAAKLARFPRTTYGVTTFEDEEPIVRRGSGPTLERVLKAAGLKPALVGAVTAVADDGYSATVTLGEALFGSQQLALALREDGAPLAQPRLIVDGDRRASRWVGSISNLVVRCLPGRQCKR